MIKTKNEKRKTKNGFTLIELLIVIFVLSILGLIASQLFSNILKGTNKAQVNSEVKQNGQFVLDTLERHIHQASSVCVIGADPNTCASSGGSSGDKLTLRKSTGEDQIALVPALDTSSPADGVLDENGKLTLNGLSITNTDPKKGVHVETVSFTLPLVPEGAPQVVQVDITLSQGVRAPSRSDFTAEVQLTNTYSLRTY